MTVWQADLYKLAINDGDGKIWYFVICDGEGNLIHKTQCLQSEVNSDWLTEQIKIASQKSPVSVILIFRPQVLNLFQTAARSLNIFIEATRHTDAIKKYILGEGLSISLEKAPPQPAPENLWGDNWRLASFKAGDLVEFWRERPTPIISLPPGFEPLSLGLSSAQMIPGLVIYGGRKSYKLAQWIDSVQPVCLDYIANEPGVSGGVILESGLVDRWVLLTFEDADMARAMENYEIRKRDCRGLHFLLIQPDDSNVTFTAFWLLKNPQS